MESDMSMIKKLFIVAIAFFAIWSCGKKEEPWVEPEPPEIKPIPEDSVFYDMDLMYVDLLGHTIGRLDGQNKFYDYPEEVREKKIITALRHLRAKKPELGYAYFVVKSDNFTNPYYKRGNKLSNLTNIICNSKEERLPGAGGKTSSGYGYTYRDFKTPLSHWVKDAYLYTHVIERHARLEVEYARRENREIRKPLEVYANIGHLDRGTSIKYITKEEIVKIEEFIRKKYPEKAEWILSSEGF